MIYVTLLIIFALAACFQDDFPPNQNWECEDCNVDDAHKQLIYGMIRHAIYVENREVYLNFDHSWMDRMLKTSIRVKVKNVPRDKLATLILPKQEQPPEHSKDEQFNVVYSPASTSRELSLDEQEDMDRFLMNNPCWIPLHDPPVKLPGNASASTSSNTPTERSTTDYTHSAIFLRLPAHGYHPTCLMYTYVTEKQNPSSCPSKDQPGLMDGAGAIAVNWLGNIGWANALHPLVEHIVGAMHNQQIILTPRAWDNGAAKPVTVNVNGKQVVASGPWSAWADPSECPVDIFAWDPWHCFFISLSKCNNPELHDIKFVEHPKPDPVVKTEYMERLEMWKGKRETYGDAPHLGNEWEFARMISFAQRPNIATRARLRLALKKLVLLRPNGMYGNAVDSVRHRHLPKMEPCLGMHVRHGDSQNDERGGKLDRSLQAHVTCAQELAQDMALQSIFLATDDNKLFAEAPAMYPQYTWHAQVRALNNFTGGSFGYHSERSMQQEIANLLADQIFMSRCAALVGTWNPGGFMKLLLQVSCSRSDIGKCPPSRELKRCQNK